MSRLCALVTLSLLSRSFCQDLEGDSCLLGGANCSVSLLQAAPAERRKGGQALLERASAAGAEDSDEQLQELFTKFNLTGRVDGRPGIMNAGRDKSLVVIVTHRELVIGCHRFEQFLSPDFHTWFVFEKNFAKHWGLDKKVQDLNSYGHPHLLTTDVVTGEVHARAAVLSILQHEAAKGTGPKELPEFMYSTMCDIQELPQWHPYHTPFPTMVWEMVRALSNEKEARAARRGTIAQDVPEYRDDKFVSVNESCMHADPATRVNYPVLTMNNLIIETLPFEHNVSHAQMHGRDVGGFTGQGGLEVAKPWKAPREGEKPKIWLSDVTTFVEDHSILYDVALYLTLMGDASIQDQLLRTGDMLYHNEVYLGELACRYDLVSLRHNDIFTYYDRAHPQDMADGKRQVFDIPAYSDVDLDFVRQYNLEVLAERDSPIARLTQYMSAAANMKSTNNIDWGNSFAVQHLDRWWLPSMLQQPPQGREGSLSQLKSKLSPLFKIAGWEPAGPSDSHWLLRRVTVPMARFFFTSTKKQLTPPEAPKGLYEEPTDLLMPADCEKFHCELFLDLWLPAASERMAIWGTDKQKIKVDEIAGIDLSGLFQVPILTGLVKDPEATNLKLPWSAELIYVGRPFGKNPLLTATDPELRLAAKRTCLQEQGKELDDEDIFLPRGEDRFRPELAPFRVGNAQGVPPQLGFDACPQYM
eukprot:gb/GFBE01060206.1/.p1 GENE.gb/GFBE01060206.1/~~gb/GFBE01060206.1/.p1  ORF type:complete len:698 (+),score=177.94 gb/GFBE01060206.1/:1-2094(+)